MDSGDAPNGLSPDSMRDAGSQPAPQSRRERLTAWLRRNSTHALLVGVVVAIVGAVVPLVATGMWNEMFPKDKAKPAKCPETKAACDGKNPQQENCGVNAKTFQPTRNNEAILQVRYSSRCGAVWGRITNGEVGDKVTITARGGGAREAVIKTLNDKFTNMIAVDDSFSVEVCAVPSINLDRKATWKRYCIHATEKTAWKIE